MKELLQEKELKNDKILNLYHLYIIVFFIPFNNNLDENIIISRPI